MSQVTAESVRVAHAVGADLHRCVGPSPFFNLAFVGSVRNLRNGTQTTDTESVRETKSPHLGQHIQ